MEGGHGMAEENVNQDGGRVEGRGARFPERGRPIERLKNSLACSILESILPPPPPWILLFPPPPSPFPLQASSSQRTSASRERDDPVRNSGVGRDVRRGEK